MMEESPSSLSGGNSRGGVGRFPSGVLSLVLPGVGEGDEVSLEGVASLVEGVSLSLEGESVVILVVRCFSVGVIVLFLKYSS